MTSWFSSMSDTLKKRACRFLLHRYLGQFLKVQLTLEQLSLDLSNGVGIVNDINIDVQAVNDALESGGLPFKMIDGFIGLINVSVPWKTLDQESCDLEIDQLVVTLQPRPNVTTFDNSADLLGSMIASMIGSMISTMNLANQVVEQAETVHSKMEGIEDFAGLIDTGNWAGQDLFYSLSSNEKQSNTISSPGIAARVVQESEVSSVAMSDSPFGNAPDLLANSKVKIAKNVAFSSFEEESEQTHFKMRFSFLCVVYKDPLNDIIRPWNELCASQATMSTDFLESCRNVSFGARTNFDTLDGARNDCCSSDCIRILAAPISTEYTESRVGGSRSGRGSSHFDRNIGCLVAKCGNVGIKECLFEENVDANFEPSYTEILTFNSPESKDEPALVVQMSSAVDGTRLPIFASNLASVNVDLDFANCVL